MPKNFCLAITLMITVLFIFSCSQQEKSEMEQPVSEKRETIPADTSGMDEHAAHTPIEKREMTSESTMSGMDEHAGHAAMVTSSDGEKTIRFWTCVMHPTVKMPEPGGCPVCKMDLIPIYEGSGLELTEQQKALIPVRTEPVAFREVSREIRTVGILDYNETRMAYASTRISGWIENLHIDFTGINVREGDELLSIYSPELVTAQEEYLTALKSIEELQNTEYAELRRSVEQTVTAAKSKLELYGLTLDQIEDIRNRGAVSTTLPLFAPMAGTVVHMNVAQGQHVNKGMNLYRIADLKSLWIMADVYEYELPWIYMGQAVEMTTQSMPGLTFPGKVTYIYPFFDTRTRTQKVQIEVSNPTGRLRPGMYVTLQIKPTLAEIYTQGAISKAPYACPMHPWVTSEHPTECEICGMDLEPTHSDVVGTESVSDTEGKWVCPMHPEVRSDEFGECSICGMDLVEKQPTTETRAHSHGHQHAHAPSVHADQPPLIFKYVCPDHPDEYATVPGLCPHDGKSLVMTGEVLTVPKSAIIDTGLRKIVFVDRGESGYEQIEVEVGPEAWGTSGDSETKRRYYPIVSGLTPGDMVVTHGNFLIDSQTQLTGSASGAYGGALGGGEESKPPVHQH
ncbi:MAG: efflux RND transporter periplasmic adaptor subunit [Candidatus Poribacteria bacterium]|nr:efflux RND transporter periplasmic adaptor subunit [Candidatus Poribacteria bacterium]